MSARPLHPTILPERRGFLRRRPAGPVAGEPEQPAAPAAPTSEPAVRPDLSGADWPDELSGLSSLERLAVRAPEIAAREAEERKWREQEERAAAEAAAAAAEERQRRLREESLDMAERLASLVEQRAPRVEWDAGPGGGRAAS